MELRQLKYFLAVADARSFVSAADALFISRQAISKSISQLEHELGVELFMRNSSGAFLTPAGIMFYDRIRSNVIELDQIRSEMQRYGSRYHQHIRLVFSVGLSRIYEQALLSFRSEQENMELEYRECPEEQCVSALLKHEADHALCVNRPQDAVFSAELLLRSRYGVVLKEQSNLTELQELSVEDLSWLPLAALQDLRTSELCKEHGLGIKYTGYDLHRLFSLALDGLCALILPECLMSSNIPGLLWLPLTDMADWTVWLVHLQTLEHNVLYHTAFDELQSKVFRATL